MQKQLPKLFGSCFIFQKVVMQGRAQRWLSFPGGEAQSSSFSITYCSRFPSSSKPPPPRSISTSASP